MEENDCEENDREENDREENDREEYDDDEVEVHVIEERPEWYPSQIIRRDEWGSEEYTKRKYALQLSTQVIAVFSEVDSCSTKEECMQTMRDMQKQDKSEGLADIRYNFYIGEDGNIYEGRGWFETPDPPEEFESLWGKLLMVGLIGNINDPPGEIRPKLFEDLVQLGRDFYFITPHAKVMQLLKSRQPDIEEPTSPETNPEQSIEAAQCSDGAIT